MWAASAYGSFRRSYVLPPQVFLRVAFSLPHRGGLAGDLDADHAGRGCAADEAIEPVVVGAAGSLPGLGELRGRSWTARATRRALVRTGPVISSCGVIMAATLGSLISGHLVPLRQLGFALALGMLIDTFVIRPVLPPAFVALTGRTGRPGGIIH